MALCGLWLLQLGLSFAGGQTDTSNLAGRLDPLFAPWQSGAAPGLAVLVQHHGRIVYQKCLGLADLENRVPITPETRFNLASVSKHITGFGVLLLTREGRLALDDDIHRFFPELPDYDRPVTFRHLLHQSSGLWEFFTVLTSYAGFSSRDFITLRDVIALLQGQTGLVFPPGSRFAYTNTNYCLLAEAIHRATGTTFGEWCRQHIFEPLGMDDTVVADDCTRLIPRRAASYEKAGREWVFSRPANINVPGSAHIFASLRDMGRWLENFRTRRVGGDSLFAEYWTPGKLSDGTSIDYAAGLMTDERRNRKIVYHSGSTGGYQTMLIYCPGEEWGVVVLANGRSIGAANLAFQVFDACFPPSPDAQAVAPPFPAGAAEARPWISLDQAHLDRWVGGYHLSPGNGMVGVYRDNTFLVTVVAGESKMYFWPVSETEFLSIDRTTRLEFHLDGSGRCNGATIRAPARTLEAAAIPLTFDPRTLTEAVGEFVCRELNTLYALEAREGRLFLTHRRYEPQPLIPLEADRFICGWGILRLEREGNGRIRGFRLRDDSFGDQALRFIRIE